MDFITRFVDQPMLHGASRALKLWHERSRRSPDQLAPLWALIVITCLLTLSWWLLSGISSLFAVATLVTLSFPPAWKLMAGPRRRSYDARAYRALAAIAVRRRETEWVVRVLVLFISACLPLIARVDDPAGQFFVIGSAIWFVMTIPANVYLAAAEPPKPTDGDEVFSRRRAVAAA